MDRARWKLIGRIATQPDTSWAKLAVKWSPEGKRKIGRPKHRWTDTVTSFLRSLGKQQDLWQVASNTIRWTTLGHQYATSFS